MPLIERYRDRLPLEDGDPVVTLHEGSTPLVEAPVISGRVGATVYLKLEGANPTGSFKDRGMTVAVSRAKGSGAEAVICASTGNTAASAAAYAARAGMRGAVIVPEGKIAIGKLAQALMHGARVIALRGNFDQALEIVRDLAQNHPIELVNSVNPYRIEGQKTAAFEVCDELDGPPDALSIPVGNAGNITSWWRGFREYEVAPVLYGFQAEGAAPLVHGEPVSDVGRQRESDRGKAFQAFTMECHGGNHAGHRRQHDQQLVDGVEDRLLVLLKIPVVARERQPLQSREKSSQVADQASGLAASQLSNIRILLLRHGR